jgi:hypothetical protein
MRPLINLVILLLLLAGGLLVAISIPESRLIVEDLVVSWPLERKAWIAQIGDAPYQWAFYLAASLALLLWIRPRKKLPVASSPAPVDSPPIPTQRTGSSPNPRGDAKEAAQWIREGGRVSTISAGGNAECGNRDPYLVGGALTSVFVMALIAFALYMDAAPESSDTSYPVQEARSMMGTAYDSGVQFAHQFGRSTESEVIDAARHYYNGIVRRSAKSDNEMLKVITQHTATAFAMGIKSVHSPTGMTRDEVINSILNRLQNRFEPR